MTPLFKKLNYKAQNPIFIVNSPTEFQSEMREMSQVCSIETDINVNSRLEFVMVFVTEQKQIEEMAPVISSQTVNDASFWFVYPKGTSKKYSCDFNRDSGWDSIRQMGWEVVRMVSVDENWSAMRYRKKEFIKVMTRKF